MKSADNSFDKHRILSGHYRSHSLSGRAVRPDANDGGVDKQSLLTERRSDGAASAIFLEETWRATCSRPIRSE